MEKLFAYEEHFSCKNYVSDINVGFKKIQFEADVELVSESTRVNYLVFILDGDVCVSCNEFINLIFHSGEMIFIGQASNLRGRTLTSGSLVVFTFEKPSCLCDKLELQSLASVCSSMEYSLVGLEIRPIVLDFLTLLSCYLESGAACRHLHEIKHKELFLLLRFYYSRKELARLFHPIIGRSLDFRELVLRNYLRTPKVRNLAEICGFSMTTFTEKFKKEFNATPLEWMHKQKAGHIRNRLADLSLTIKDIVDEFDFVSQTHLNTYCKKFFGATAVEVRSMIVAENFSLTENVSTPR